MDTPRKPRLLHTLTNLPWWLPLLLATILALDACSRPNDPPAAASDFGLWLKGKHQSRGSRHPSSMQYTVVRLDDGRVIVDEGVYEGLAPRGEVIERVSLLGAWRRDRGFWGMTERTYRLFLDDYLLELGDEDRRACGDAIDRLWAGIDDGMNDQRRAGQMMRDGVTTITEPLPTGYLHNALAITLALALLWSCTLGHPRRSWAAWRRDYHLAHNRCPHCRYPTHAYPGTTCPECGHDWGDPADHIEH